MEGIGTELCIVSLVAWFVMAADRWLYPIYKRWQARRNNNPGKRASDTLKLNSDSKMVDVKLLQQAFEIHEKDIDKCVEEIKVEIKELRRDLTGHETRLSVLESHRQ